MDRVERSGLNIDAKLADFIDNEVLAPLGQDAAKFWQDFAALLERLVPVNRSLLARRDGLVTPVETEKGWRRGIYVNQRRTDLPTLSENFDLPAMNPNCLERSESIVAPQALHLLNNSMVHELAASFAERVRREAGVDPGRQVEQAYWWAMSRAPNPEEKAASLAALAQFEQVSKADGLKKFCHTLMNSASFIYID